MLNGKIIEEWRGVNLPEDVRNKIVQILTWSDGAPPFPSVGRTAFLALSAPVPISGVDSRVVRSLKIKGVGLKDYVGRLSQPSTLPYYRANMHLGFNEAGQSIAVASEPSPLGGMTLLRARAEFECAKKLFESACPAELPVALAAYPGLEFDVHTSQSSSLGAVICGLPVEFSARLGELLMQSAGRSEARTSLRNAAKTESHYELLRYVYLRLGRALRKFHQSGFHRYSGHPGNFIFDPNAREIVLVDLDSSQIIQQMPTSLRKPYLIRDLASAIYHLGAYVLRADNIAVWRYTPEQSVNLMAQILKGYLLNAEAALLKRFKEKYLPVYSEAAKIAPQRHALKEDSDVPPIEAYQDYRNAHLRHYWVNREEHFATLMSLLTPLLNVDLDSKMYLVTKGELC